MSNEESKIFDKFGAKIYGREKTRGIKCDVALPVQTPKRDQ
ncbi:MAG: hypothetical protein CM15mP44_7170 [Candidatus Neomarinimicrobiota bacterium]|nr:MAG: hypothetical protein CM15mP44_7170 [Candidatus Neomarinimicrobiota bacterium]